MKREMFFYFLLGVLLGALTISAPFARANASQEFAEFLSAPPLTSDAISAIERRARGLPARGETHPRAVRADEVNALEETVQHHRTLIEASSTVLRESFKDYFDAVRALIVIHASQRDWRTWLRARALILPARLVVEYLGDRTQLAKNRLGEYFVPYTLEPVEPIAAKEGGRYRLMQSPEFVSGVVLELSIASSKPTATGPKTPTDTKLLTLAQYVLSKQLLQNAESLSLLLASDASETIPSSLEQKWLSLGISIKESRAAALDRKREQEYREALAARVGQRLNAIPAEERAAWSRTTIERMLRSVQKIRAFSEDIRVRLEVEIHQALTERSIGPLQAWILYYPLPLAEMSNAARAQVLMDGWSEIALAQIFGVWEQALTRREVTFSESQITALGKEVVRFSTLATKTSQASVMSATPLQQAWTELSAYTAASVDSTVQKVRATPRATQTLTQRLIRDYRLWKAIHDNGASHTRPALAQIMATPAAPSRLIAWLKRDQPKLFVDLPDRAASLIQELATQKDFADAQRVFTRSLTDLYRAAQGPIDPEAGQAPFVDPETGLVNLPLAQAWAQKADFVPRSLLPGTARSAVAEARRAAVERLLQLGEALSLSRPMIDSQRTGDPAIYAAVIGPRINQDPKRFTKIWAELELAALHERYPLLSESVIALSLGDRSDVRPRSVLDWIAFTVSEQAKSVFPDQSVSILEPIVIQALKQTRSRISSTLNKIARANSLEDLRAPLYSSIFLQDFLTALPELRPALRDQMRKLETPSSIDQLFSGAVSPYVVYGFIGVAVLELGSRIPTPLAPVIRTLAWGVEPLLKGFMASAAFAAAADSAYRATRFSELASEQSLRSALYRSRAENAENSSVIIRWGDYVSGQQKTRQELALLSIGMALDVPFLYVPALRALRGSSQRLKNGTQP